MRRSFDEWLSELREIVAGVYEVELTSMPEFDMADARSYYKDKSSPSLYFKECLSEYGDGETIERVLTRYER